MPNYPEIHDVKVENGETLYLNTSDEGRFTDWQTVDEIMDCNLITKEELAIKIWKFYFPELF